MKARHAKASQVTGKCLEQKTPKKRLIAPNCCRKREEPIDCHSASTPSLDKCIFTPGSPTHPFGPLRSLLPMDIVSASRSSEYGCTNSRYRAPATHAIPLLPTSVYGVPSARCEQKPTGIVLNDARRVAACAHDAAHKPVGRVYALRCMLRRHGQKTDVVRGLLVLVAMVVHIHAHTATIGGGDGAIVVEKPFVIIFVAALHCQSPPPGCAVDMDTRNTVRDTERPCRLTS